MPRQSVRISSKPTIRYISVDDEVQEVIERVCRARKWTFCPELLDEFEEYYQTVKYSEHFRSLEKIYIAEQWILHISERITYEIALNNAVHFVKKYCKEHNFKFEKRMPQAYLDWYNDSKNKDKVTYIYKAAECNCMWCKERAQIVPHPSQYSMNHSHEHCVGVWFGNLKKCIIW